jgi:hypothetical protein
MNPPNTLSNAAICVDCCENNSYFLVKDTPDNSWQTMVLTSLPLSKQTPSTWELQVVSCGNNELHVGFLYGHEHPMNWIPLTTSHWLGEIESPTLNGLSIDPITPDSLFSYRVCTNYLSTNGASRRVTRTPPVPLQTGNTIRFVFDPIAGTIWMSLSIDCFLQQYLLSSGLENKLVYPAVSLLCDSDSVIYFPSEIHCQMQEIEKNYELLSH